MSVHWPIMRTKKSLTALFWYCQRQWIRFVSGYGFKGCSIRRVVLARSGGRHESSQFSNSRYPASQTLFWTKWSTLCSAGKRSKDSASPGRSGDQSESVKPRQERLSWLILYEGIETWTETVSPERRLLKLLAARSMGIDFIDSQVLATAGLKPTGQHRCKSTLSVGSVWRECSDRRSFL